MSEPTVTVETDARIVLDAHDLSKLIGDQIIIQGNARPFGYLAGIAFDGMKGDNDPVDILIEFFENEQSFDLTDDEIDEIEQMLRESRGGR